jgi:hypothetical protein
MVGDIIADSRATSPEISIPRSAKISDLETDFSLTKKGV